MRRALMVGITAVGIAMGATAPAQAHSTDDWYWVDGWSGLSNSRQTGSYGMVLPEGYGRGTGRVDWNSAGTVEVRTGAEDWVNDTWCVVTQIRYKVKTDGTWADHYHYRSPAVDCDINDGMAVSGVAHSRYPTKDLQFRACRGYRDGEIAPGTEAQCTDWT